MSQSMSDVNNKTRHKWKALLQNSQNGICAMCLQPMKKDATFDHIRPKALGGKTVLDNLQLVHRLCNEKHGTIINQRLQEQLQPR